MGLTDSGKLMHGHAHLMMRKLSGVGADIAWQPTIMAQHVFKCGAKAVKTLTDPVCDIRDTPIVQDKQCVFQRDIVQIGFAPCRGQQIIKPFLP
ncbi:hypothetical protein [uncultured Tateyamaria sp.]|uniref:hypothetical protein n=1 Tax=uncultured Tateyamaria sp. TaxID=455651 RepID=UPI002638F265|nr:hypothetical protein [uncultured Tateyamaria sp.]